MQHNYNTAFTKNEHRTLQDPFKLWPMLAISGWKSNRGGAIRLWFMARAIDHNGRGWVEASELREYAGALGVKRRTLYQWQGEALRVGFIRKAGSRFYMIGLGRAAALLKCRVGRPILINGKALARHGWRSHVWAGYLATVGQRPISQRVKKRLTGVTARTQVNYQRDFTSIKRSNYASRGKGSQLDAAAWRDIHGLAIFEKNGRLIQRLPDVRTVPMNTAQVCHPGRSRKAQRQVNSLYLEREQGNVVRLFHTYQDKAESTRRKMAHDDIPPWNIPELFMLSKVAANYNVWQVMT